MTGAHPFGTQITTQQLIQQFLSLTSREERYRQLILLAKQLPTLDESTKQSMTEISGCENRLWLSYQLHTNNTLHFYGDSEGRIVKGLLAIILTLIEGKTVQQIAKVDMMHFLDQLGLANQLSQSRLDGLQAIISYLKTIQT